LVPSSQSPLLPQAQANLEGSAGMLQKSREGVTAGNVQEISIASPQSSTPIPTRTIDISMLRDYLGERIPDYMIPTHFIQVENIPFTPAGKVDREQLKKIAGIRLRTAVTYVAPDTQLEKTLVTVWKEVLKLDQVGIDDNFFEAGGTSLSLIRVNSRLKEELQRDIPVVWLYQHTTIRALARFLGRQQGTGEAVAPRIDRTREINKAREEIKKQKARRRLSRP